MGRKKTGIKRVGLCIRAKRNERMAAQLLQRDGMRQKVAEDGSADGDLLNFPDICLLEGCRVQHRRCDDGKIGGRLAQGGDGLRRRMVADAQANARIAGAEGFKHRQEHTAQCALARGKKNGARL